MTVIVAIFIFSCFFFHFTTFLLLFQQNYDTTDNSDNADTDLLIENVDDTTEGVEVLNGTGGAKYYGIPFHKAGNAEEQAEDEKYLQAVWAAFNRDHPEVFWLSGTQSTVTTTDYKTYLILSSSDAYDIRAKDDKGTADGVDYTDPAAIRSAITQVNDQIDAILKRAQNSESNAETVRIFNQWLTKNNGYNSSADLNHIAHDCRTCVSALAGTPRGVTSPVCEGYARAFKVLCDKAGIPCTLVDGNARNGQTDVKGEAHMWNYVQMEDGNWYAVDVTWNDPLMESPSGEITDADGSEEYLLVGKNTEIDGLRFIDSHPVTNRLTNDGVGFINGPALAEEAYKASTALALSYNIPSDVMVFESGVIQPVVKNGTDGDAVRTYEKISGEFPNGVVLNGDGSISYNFIQATETSATVTIRLTEKQAGSTQQIVDCTVTFPPVKRLTLDVEGFHFPGSDGLVYDGNPQSIPAVSYNGTPAASSLEFTTTYEKNGETVAQPTDAGNYIVYVSRDQDDVYNKVDKTEVGTFTIQKAKLTASDDTQQDVVKGVGNFSEPTLSPNVAGEWNYTYNGESYSKADLQAVLAGMDTTAEPISVVAIFDPESENYLSCTVTLHLTIVDVRFTVGGETASQSNAVTIEDHNLEYGAASWGNVVAIKSDEIAAHLGELICEAPTYTLDKELSEIPAVGTHTVNVVFSGVIGGKEYTKVPVCTVTVTIRKKSIVPIVEVAAGEYVYTGKEIRPAVTVKNGAVELPADQYTVEYTGNINAGEASVAVTPAENSSYDWTVATGTFTIEKAEYPRQNGEASAKFGESGSLNLTKFAPEDSEYSIITEYISNPDSVLADEPVIAGSTLSWRFVDDAEKVGKTAGIPIRVTHPNYNDFQFDVILTVADKLTQELTYEDVTKTYGNADFDHLVIGARGEVTYTSSDETVATIDEKTGRVHIVGAGSCHLIATAAGDADYQSASIEAALIVNPATITITAASYTITAGQAAPELGAELGKDYTVSGLIDDDKLLITEENPIMVKYETEPDTSVVGTTAILISGGAVPNSNYNAEIVYINGTLTVTRKHRPSRPSSGSSSSSGSGSSGSGSASKPDKKDDGTKTTTKTGSDGTVTETTTRKDGSETVIETKPDGTVTTTDSEADGTTTKTVEKSDGSSEITLTQPDGTTATTMVDRDGRTESSVTISKESAGGQRGGAIALPIPAVRPNQDTSRAPTVSVTLPSGAAAAVEVPVSGVTAGTVAIVVSPTGTETVLKASVPTGDGIAFRVSGDVTVKIVDNSKSFSDVVPGDWHKNAVDFAVSRGLFNGTSSMTFTPDGTMTRGMIATVLHNLENNPAATAVSTFTDVKRGDWYESALQWASGKGLISGYGNGRVGPNDPITREQLAVILWKYAGSPAASGSLAFSDSLSISDYAETAMLWATQNGILSGSNSSLNPTASASRAQVAQMLMNYMETTIQ